MNEDIINKLSPGPYRWGIYEEATAKENAMKMLDFGSGDVHCVILPEHPLSKASDDPDRPEHAVTLCMTGNGPNSKNNAQALVVLLTQREIIKSGRPTLPIPTTPDCVAWAEYAQGLEEALGIAPVIPERLRTWNPANTPATGGGEEP